MFVESRDLRQFAYFAGKDFVDIIPAKLVVSLTVGDSNKVFSHVLVLY